MFDYWFGTGDDSAIKSISSKPLLVTARDATVAVAITIVITLIASWIYFEFIGEDDQRDYTGLVVKAVAATILSQFVYEYIGVNAMIAESSLRYAKGSALAKYATRRHAIIYEYYYKMSALPSPKPRADIFRMLKTAAASPRILGDLVDTPRTRARALRRVSPAARQIWDEIIALPDISVVAAVCTGLTPAICCDVLAHGFYSSIAMMSAREIVERRNALLERVERAAEAAGDHVDAAD